MKESIARKVSHTRVYPRIDAHDEGMTSQRRSRVVIDWPIESVMNEGDSTRSVFRLSCTQINKLLGRKISTLSAEVCVPNGVVSFYFILFFLSAPLGFTVVVVVIVNESFDDGHSSSSVLC